MKKLKQILFLSLVVPSLIACEYIPTTSITSKDTSITSSQITSEQTSSRSDEYTSEAKSENHSLHPEESSYYSYSSEKLYEINFYDDEENLLTTKYYPKGTIPSYDNVPNKAKDRQMYKFDHWEPAYQEVQGDQSYVASYVFYKNIYKVTFLDDDKKTILSEVDCLEGDVPVYDKLTPQKEPSVAFTYSFDGWEEELSPVIGDTTYTAKYKSIDRVYTVYWMNEDELIYEDYCVYSSTPLYRYSEYGTPLKEVDHEGYHYIFEGWEEEITKIDHDTTYHAKFKEVPDYVKAKFYNYDGTLLEEDDVPYNTTPIYQGNTPTKSSDKYGNYHFDKWDTPLHNIIEDTSYTATYTLSYHSYRVTLKSSIDGSIIANLHYHYLETPEYKSTPTQDRTAQYTYTFTGWDREFEPVEDDTTYYAQFDANVRYYTINFINNDDTVLQSEQVAYGDTPVYKGETPTYESTGKEYTFNGWNKPLVPVTQSTSYRATYTSSYKKYNITWNNYDGSTILVNQVEYYNKPVYGGDTPTREESKYSEYIFVGWDPNITYATSDATYTAKFSTRYFLKYGLDSATKTQRVNGYNTQSKCPSTIYFGGTYNDMAVTRIAAEAFKDNTIIKNAILEEGMLEISERAFYNATSLETVIIPTSLTTIKANAFYRDNTTNEINIFYLGDENNDLFTSSYLEELANLNIHVYYYSEIEKEGNYWHYVEGVPTIYQ